MHKVIVAGAGHGGLTAAANLAKNGFDVTVVEAQPREGLGYDWGDALCRSTFDFVGIPQPDEIHLRKCYPMNYQNPKKTIMVKDSGQPSDNIRFVERKFILKYLVDYAESCGVKFLFETKVLSAICDVGRVSGIKVEKDGKTEELYADMIIDAAGMNSPVRRSLPSRFGIDNEVNPKYVFTVYRAYYEKLENKTSDYRYCAFFDNCGHCGMDWMITEDGYMDVLVGCFSDKLSQAEIDESLAEMKRLYPYLSDKIFRGGQVAQIPVGKALRKMVCGGYAAVGDSAFMTGALSGSGMDFAMRAGKILSDVMLEADGDFSVEKLWKYQYTFYKKEYIGQLGSYQIKSMMTVLSADDMDYMFEKKILSEKEMFNRNNAKYTAGELLSKAVYLCAKPKILKALAEMGLKTLMIDRVMALMPEKYTDFDFHKWQKEYSKL